VNREDLQKLLRQVRDRRLSILEALEELRHMPYEDLGFAKPDHHRSIRKGFPEVIFAGGKTPEQIVAIAKSLVAKKQSVLITRLWEKKVEPIKRALPGFVYHPEARAGTVLTKKIKPRGRGTILVISAGTADLPVSEEALLTASLMGNRVERLTDVGVAGIHRLFENRRQLFSASVLIVVAGMEGALPSVVGGLVDRPVIAVPTSVGYGASFSGLAALLAMLNSCAAGVTVVNIDNGFGAGYAASLVNQL
jgi:NCAIR mutase (PurE)-related protein